MSMYKNGQKVLTTEEKTDVNTEADTALTNYDPPTDTEMNSGHAPLVRTKVTGSLAYDVSEISEEAANANTKIISIDNGTYPMFKTEKIYVNIKGWHDVADAAETLKILMRLETDDAGTIGADDDLKIKTYTEGTDVENVIVIDDISAGVDVDIYVYTGGAMDAVDDFTITWHYLLSTIG